MAVKKITEKHDSVMYEGRRNWYIIAFGLSLVTLIVTSLIATKQHLMGWEITIFHTINGWPDSLTWPFKAASVAQDSMWIAAAAVVATFALRMWRLSWRLAASTVGGYAIAFLLKHEIARPRPEGFLHDVHQRWTDTGAGFPSGHMMIMTVVMLSVLPYLPSKWRWLVPALIIMTGLSRVYLGAHAPLDIIGGFAVGLLVVSLIRIMPQSLRVFFRLD